MDAPCILHVDIDAFFAAVEQVLDPELQGRPVVVGGGAGGRGVVASASYEARRYGLKAGMPIYKAKELCPNGAFIAGHHEEYNRFAERVSDILCGLSPSVEQASLDEAYVDLRGCERMYDLWAVRPIGRLPFLREADGVYRRSERRAVPPSQRRRLPRACRWPGAVALWLRRAVRARTGLEVSVGVGPNKLIAKTASDFGKPCGVTVVEPGAEAIFLGLLELKDIPGIGRSVREKFRKWNVRRVEEARRLSVELLRDAFGPQRGRAIHSLLHGSAGEPVELSGDEPPKSISRETTFWSATNDFEFVESMLFSLTERMGRALRREGMEGRTVRAKVRYSDFNTVQRSRSMGRYSDCDEAIFEVARDLLRRCWSRTRRIRLVGVGVTDLRPSRVFQDRLFDDDLERSRRIDRCLDELRERFGFDAVRRGPAIRLDREEDAAEPPDISALVRR
ncbi:MAG: DNA polymerase Y family protein [Planctomycetota bacterium]